MVNNNNNIMELYLSVYNLLENYFSQEVMFVLFGQSNSDVKVMVMLIQERSIININSNSDTTGNGNDNEKDGKGNSYGIQ